MERKCVNDSLPHHLRQNLPTIDDLQLPCFESGAIGCLHEATEMYLLSKFFNNLISIFSIFLFYFVNNNGYKLIFRKFEIPAMFGNATVTTYHRNRVTTTVEDIRLVRRILRENV